MLAAELQLLDQLYSTSLILTASVAGPATTAATSTSTTNTVAPGSLPMHLGGTGTTPAEAAAATQLAGAAWRHVLRLDAGPGGGAAAPVVAEVVAEVHKADGTAGGGAAGSGATCTSPARPAVCRDALHAAAEAGDAAWAALGVRQRLRCLASHAIAPHLAVECEAPEGGAGGGGRLWLIPTYSRINRRVPYDATDPLGHMDLA